MGKKAKNKNAERRKREKASRKEAQKRRYGEYAASGANSKRAKNKVAGRDTVSPHKHAIANCGNTGCQRCFPRKESVS